MELNKILKCIIIVLLILLAILSITYKFGNCDNCKFEIEDKVYNTGEFMLLYSDKCLNPKPILFGEPLNVIIP